MTDVAIPLTATSTVHASLVARGNDVSPDQITEYLGIRPTRAWSADSTHGESRSRTRRDHWAWDLGEGSSDDLAEQLAVIADALPPQAPEKIALFAFVSLTSSGDRSRFKL